MCNISHENVHYINSVSKKKKQYEVEVGVGYGCLLIWECHPSSQDLIKRHQYINILQGLSFSENWFINNASRSLKDFGHVERHNVLERT